MPIYTPYFYIIQEIETGKYYAGSKYSKQANPNTLMQEGGYITSSKHIQAIVEEKGVGAFRVCKIRKFETASKAYDYETRFLQKVDAKRNDKFFNMHNNDAFLAYDPEWRKIPDKNGITSYQKGGQKAAKTMCEKITDGKNVYQISYEKAINKNPELNKIRSKKSVETKKLNGVYDLVSQKISGDNNPSKKPENAKRISEGRKKYISENREEWLGRQAKVNAKLSTEKDENGLTVRDKHSLWMKENNPTRGSVWINNGTSNLRIKKGESIPDGYSLGRIKKKF